MKRLKQRLRRQTENHNVVLIMHGAAREVSVMELLDINLNPVFTIDTTTAVRHLFTRTNLRCLLEEYEIPHEKGRLHYAGNDAHFILRVLLMIAVRHVKAKLRGRDRPDWIPIFEAVARSPKPELEALRERGPRQITAGNRERRQMERRRKLLEGIETRLIEDEKETREWWGSSQRLPDCDVMSPPWADRYTISQYGMLP